MKKIIICLLLIAFFSKLEATEFSARAFVDKDSILIGDKIRLTIVFASPNDIHTIMPILPEKIGNFELLNIESQRDTSFANSKRVIKEEHFITCFDSGSFELPAFTIMYEKSGFSTLYPIHTNPIPINVFTVSVDLAEDIKPIIPPIDEPRTFWDYFPYILIIIAIIIITLLAYWSYKKYKHKPKPIIIEQKPKIAPEIIAMNELKRIENERIWETGKIKQYYSQLTDVIRIYIEEKLQEPAMESTSSEILFALKKHILNNELLSKVRQLLELADLAKFAKHQPNNQDSELALKYAYEFVQQTMHLNQLENNSNQKEGKNNE